MPRHSAAVYRRRRLALLLVVLLVLGLIGGGIWLAVAQPWNAAPGPTPTPSASTSEESQPSPSAQESASPEPEETPTIAACTATDVQVSALTDAESYASGALPQLSIELTNTSKNDCTINVGSSTQKFIVASGDDVWWRSTDCQQEPSDMVVTLTAGQSVTSVQPVTWDRTRSSTDTCEQENRPRAPGGGASYHVTVSIGGFESEQSRQIMLY